MKGAAAMKKESKDNEFGFSSAENQNNESFPREKSGMSAKRKAWIYSVRACLLYTSITAHQIQLQSSVFHLLKVEQLIRNA